MSVRCIVIPGKVPGSWSYDCEFCGDCGGNYKSRDMAQVLAIRHGETDCPEHRPKPNSMTTHHPRQPGLTLTRCDDCEAWFEDIHQHVEESVTVTVEAEAEEP